MRYQNGDTYVGGHKSGIKTGLGIYISKESGVEYTGEWRDGHRHGKGEMQYTRDNGSKFVGVFHND